jgi:hypothetical protein
MTTKNKILSTLGAVAIALGVQQANAITTNLISSDISVNTTWTSNFVYQLTKPVFVTNGATLTITTGTVVRGEQAVGTDPGALVISRGAKIKALGTRDNPIVFTDLNDDNIGGNTGTGIYGVTNNGLCRKWGGVLLLGKTYIATDDGQGGGTFSPNAALERQIEGLEPYGVFSKYGGGDDDDDSGEMHYVSIRYGGFVLGAANEINGLTMGAVGRQTDLDHIEIFQNKDDGFEFFGGTVNCKYMVAWTAADDSYDWDEGFRGKGQFWLVVQGPLSSELDVSDKGMECDGGDGDSTQPMANPTLYNVTMVGQGRDSLNKKNAAFHMRDGTAGRVFNSLVMDFGGAPALIEGALNDGVYDAADQSTSNYVVNAFYTHEAGGTKKLMFDRVGFWKMGTNSTVGLASGSGVADDWGAEAKDENKPHLGLDIFGGAGLNNRYLSNAIPISTLTRASGGVVVGGKTYFPVIELDPTLPAGASPTYLTGGRTPPADGFYTGVKWVGAFNKLNWAAPWSTASRFGLLDSALHDTGGPVPDNTINNSAGPVTVANGVNFTNRIKLVADIYTGKQADWWVLMQRNGTNWYHYRYAQNKWFPGITNTFQGAIFDFGPFIVPNIGLPAGPNTTNVFFFAVDLNKNAVYDSPSYSDSVTLNILP